MKRLNVNLVFQISFILSCLIFSINSQDLPNDQIFCPNNVLHRIGITATCFQNYDTPISCLDPIENGAYAILKCQYGYKFSFLHIWESQHLACINGNWSRNPPECQEVSTCGNYYQNYDSLNFEDDNAGFYEKENKRYRTRAASMAGIDESSKGIVCSGIILNTKLILSSAICLKQYDKENLTVFVGLHNYNIKKSEITAQLSKVLEIYYNERYSMLSRFNYKSALAIIEVMKPFVYTTVIRPVCTDWSAQSEELFNSNTGYFINFFTSKCPDDPKLEKDLYVTDYNVNRISDLESCVNDINEYPSDIFCAKSDGSGKVMYNYLTHSNCTTIKGGGYYLKTKNFKNDAKVVLWGFLIESFLLQEPNDRSDKNITGTFVNLFNQKDFIQEYFEKFKSSKIMQYAFTNRPCRYQELISTAFDILGCTYNNVSVPCRQHLQTGSIVKVRCKFGYENLNSDFPDEFQCLNEGKWSNQLYKCQKTCGEITDPARRQLVPLIFGGKKTHIGDVPWHVSIFANNSYTNSGEYVQICGGTLINTNIVISAAHCFWNPRLGIVNDKKSYLVAAGKRYRNYNATESNRIQYSRIKEINVPKTYNELLYRHDIAILVLERSFTLNPFTKPACVDWLPYGSYDIEDKVKGRVAGWGSTSNQGESSNDLNAVEILTLSNAKCKSLVDPNFKDDITGEKFCAQGEHGETTCTGDSGGGFLVPKIEEDGVKRHYLWGVVSSGLNPVIHCTENFFSTYTNIQYHQDAIKALINENVV